jgi:hypothetical protein
MPYDKREERLTLSLIPYGCDAENLVSHLVRDLSARDYVMCHAVSVRAESGVT